MKQYAKGLPNLIQRTVITLAQALLFFLAALPSETPAADLAILAGPTDQAVALGASATFTVTADGEAPVHYQWLFYDIPIADATNTSLTLTNLCYYHAGPYAVAVTNLSGSITSSPALLTVGVTSVPNPGTVRFNNWAPDVFPEINAGIRYGDGEWVNGSNSIPLCGTYDFGGVHARAALYGGPVGTPEDQLIQIGPAVGFRTGSAAGLLDVGTTETRYIPGVPAGSAAVIQVRAWDAGQAGVDSYEEASLAQFNFLGKSPLLLISALGGGGSPPSAPAPLLGLDGFSLQGALTQEPVVLSAPRDQVVMPGMNASFSVCAFGGRTNRNLVYQWFRGTLLLSGATNSSLVVSNAQWSNAGRYSVRCRLSDNPLYERTVSANLTVDYPLQAHPQKQLYQIISGQFIQAGGFAGGMYTNSVPDSFHRFIEVTTNGFFGTIQIRFLDEKMFPKLYCLSNGLPANGYIYFSYVGGYPGSPAVPVTVDYVAQTLEGNLVLNGNLYGQNLPCCDWIYLFAHRNLVAVPVSSLASRITSETADLCWLTSVQKTYQVQYRTNLSSSAWINFGSVIPGTGQWTSSKVPRFGPQTFYRVTTSNP